MYCTFSVLKLLIFNIDKLVHSSNIDSISVTCDVSNVSGFSKLKLVNLLQPLNISHIISTFLVSKFPVRSKDSKDSQFRNIPFIVLFLAIKDGL